MIIKHYQMTEEALNNKPFEEGALYITEDTNKMYFDPVGGIKRIPIGGNPILLDSESERTNLLSPIPGTLYFILENSKIYIYYNGSWYTILENIVSFSQSLNSGTKIGTLTINGNNIDLYCKSDTNVTQTITSSNADYPLLLAPSGQTASKTTSSYFDSGVTLNPSTNTIKANISGKAGSATKLATAKKISWTGDVTGSLSFDGSTDISTALSLASSGVTANSYGPSADVSLGFGGSFKVPYYTVDTKGRITASSDKTITLPNISNIELGNCFCLIENKSGTDLTATIMYSDKNFKLLPNSIINVYTYVDIPASARLNIENTGYKYIWYHSGNDNASTSIPSGLINAGNLFTLTYTGEHYLLISGHVDSAVSSTSTNPVQNKVIKSYVDSIKITVDSAVSSTSTNPVQNKVIKSYVDSIKITVDSAVSDTSTNPVQNKVIKSYVDYVLTAAKTQIETKLSDKSPINHTHTYTDVNAVCIRLLWENASKTSEFPSQTLDLGLTDYSMYIVIARHSTDIVATVNGMSKTGYSVRLCSIGSSTSGYGEFIRTCTYVSGGSLKFGACYRNGTANNNCLIPILIYGVHGVKT